VNVKRKKNWKNEENMHARAKSKSHPHGNRQPEQDVHRFLGISYVHVHKEKGASVATSCLQHRSDVVRRLAGRVGPRGLTGMNSPGVFNELAI
jgi:hypothetical protein